MEFRTRRRHISTDDISNGDLRQPAVSINVRATELFKEITLWVSSLYCSLCLAGSYVNLRRELQAFYGRRHVVVEFEGGLAPEGQPGAAEDERHRAEDRDDDDAENGRPGAADGEGADDRHAEQQRADPHHRCLRNGLFAGHVAAGE